jgi:CRP/FNR family transcriptional regulator
LGRQLLRIMSREILADEELLVLLGKKSSEERLATLLVSLSRRFQERGFSPYEFNLSMSRNDIGNYLGLAVETVSGKSFPHRYQPGGDRGTGYQSSMD